MTDLRRNVSFSARLAFYLLGQSDSFQGPYGWTEKESLIAC